MKQADEEVVRYLSLLENKMRQRKYTQQDVQQALSWGRSYVSQLVTKQKKLRVEQVLMILQVIGVEPREFYAELYDLEQGLNPAGGLQQPETPEEVEDLKRELNEQRQLMHRLVKLLVKKRVVTAKDARQVA